MKHSPERVGIHMDVLKTDDINATEVTYPIIKGEEHLIDPSVGSKEHILVDIEGSTDDLEKKISQQELERRAEEKRIWEEYQQNIKENPRFAPLFLQTLKQSWLGKLAAGALLSANMLGFGMPKEDMRQEERNTQILEKIVPTQDEMNYTITEALQQIVAPVEVQQTIHVPATREWARDYRTNAQDIPDVRQTGDRILEQLATSVEGSEVHVSGVATASFDGDEQRNMQLTDDVAQLFQENLTTYLMEQGVSPADMDRIVFDIRGSGEQYQIDGQVFASETEMKDHIRDLLGGISERELDTRIRGYNRGAPVDDTTRSVLDRALNANRGITVSLNTEVLQEQFSDQIMPVEFSDVVTDTISTQEESQLPLRDQYPESDPYLARKMTVNTTPKRRKSTSESKGRFKDEDHDIDEPIVDPPPPPPPPPPPIHRHSQGQGSVEMQSMNTPVQRQSKTPDQRRDEQPRKNTGRKKIQLDRFGDVIPIPRRAGGGVRERARTGRDDHNPRNIKAMRRELARGKNKQQEDAMAATFGGAYDDETALTEYYRQNGELLDTNIDTPTTDQGTPKTMKDAAE